MLNNYQQEQQGTVTHGYDVAADGVTRVMADLTRRKVTPDVYRAVMRLSREVNGEAGHDRMKASALIAHVHTFGI